MTPVLQDSKTAKHAWDRSQRLSDLAKRVMVAESYLYRVMNGRTTPSLEIASRIAEEMGVSLDEFYENLNRKIETVEALV